MSALLAAASTIYAAILALLSTIAALRSPKRRGFLRTGAIVLEALVVVQAGLSVWSQLHGHRPADPAIHAQYLACSVLLLPLLVLRPRASDGTRWDDAVLALAALLVAVVTVRTLATWAA